MLYNCLYNELLNKHTDHFEIGLITCRADRDAEAIYYSYQQEAAVYEKLISELGLTKEGLLAYLSIRTITSATNNVYIGLDSPAKSSYVN